MPWKALSTMSLRHEFVTFSLCEGANISQLCDCFTISRKTGYKWIHRFVAQGTESLVDRSRRPKTSPARTSDALEKAVMEVRGNHPG
jgi:transposase